MSVAINGTNGITYNDGSVQASAIGKNLIINGNMQIAQRATSTASIIATGYYTVDRWRTLITSGGTWTQSRSADVPTGQGFERSLKMDVTSANTLAAADRVAVQQRIEGFNLASVKKGTVNAESLSLSFWVKCTSTGTFIAELGDLDNARNISATYTVDVINTWEKKTITFAADTTGEFDNNNAASLDVSFWLAAGSNYTSGTLQTPWAANTNANRAVGQTNLSSDTANEWYITGVQLEANTTATPFEHLHYGQQLALCQRYLQSSWSQGSAIGSAVSITTNSTQQSWGSNNAGIAGQAFLLPVTMRTSPTLVVYDMALNVGKVTTLGNGAAQINNVAANNSATTTNMFYVRMYANSKVGIAFAHTLTAEL